MSVKCQVILDAMERIAPRAMAEEWDNPGLLVGSPAQDVARILVCLDVSEAVIAQAVKQRADLILSHHPLLFRPVKKLRTDLPQGRMLAQLLKNDIAVFAAHTNLDSAPGGLNDLLVKKLGLVEARPLTESYREKYCKLAVFVPETHAEAVRAAVGKAGAGQIGSYSHCSFQVKGTGAFLPRAGAQPYLGAVGALETVDEVRLEVILPEKIAPRVVRAMLRAHPYEAAAYDLYPLENVIGATGLGRIGKLAQPQPLAAFAEQVKAALGLKHVRLAAADRNALVKKVALCGGSGADLVQKAAYQGADVFVTGDVKYHDAQRALECGVAVLDAGHFGTEFPVVAHLAAQLREIAAAEKWDVEILGDTQSADLLETL